MSDTANFLILGYGEQEEYLRQYCSEHKIVNILFTGGKKTEELGKYISKCDIGYLYYPTTDLNNIYCAPNKIYEYTSLGLPIVSNTNPTMEFELNKYKIGKTFNENDKDNISKNLQSAIHEIISNISYFKDNAKKFSNEFSWKNEGEKLVDIIERL